MNLVGLKSLLGRLAGFNGIESGLRRGRRLKRVSWFGIVVGALIEAATIIAPGNPGPDKLKSNALVIVGLALFIVGVVLAGLMRAWIRESREPFRYACLLGEFDPVSPDDADRLPRFAERLRHDIAGLLSERIGRLSFLDDESQVDLSTHLDVIRVRGGYLLREQPGEPCKVEVTSRVRIGPVGSGDSLAHPVKVALNSGRVPRSPVGRRVVEVAAEAYSSILERVYHNVATQIYQQIKADVEEKIVLLPTNRLRATAYLNEADDYARSNTLHAYEQARELYEGAMTRYDRRWAPLSESRGRRLAQRALWLGPWVRHGWRIGWSRVFRRAGRPVVLTARAETGFASMLFYRRRLAGLSGRRLNPLFQALPVAQAAVKRLTRLPTHVDGREDAMLEARVGLALSWQGLGRADTAQEELERARCPDPVRVEERSRFVFASALVENRLRSSLQTLRRAVDLDPRFEVARYELARQTELVWRTRPTLEESVASLTLREYQIVLEINPGNVRALANLGYMYWLFGDLDNAQEHYDRARAFKDIDPRTFVADVDIGLARIAAERGDISGAYRHYIDWVSARVSQGAAHDPSHMLDSFELVTDAIVARFHEYAEKVDEQLSRIDSDAPPSARVCRSIRALVLNDLGEAVLQRSTRSGEDLQRAAAQRAFEKARKANAQFVLPHYNLAAMFQNTSDLEEARKSVDQVLKLEPDWVNAKGLRLVFTALSSRSESDLANEELEAAEKLLSETDKPKRVDKLRTSGAEPDSGGPSVSPQTWKSVQERRAEAEGHRKEAEKHADEVNKAVRSLVPHERLWQGGDFNWSVLAPAKQPTWDLSWERKLDDLHVQALSVWLFAIALLRYTGATAERLDQRQTESAKGESGRRLQVPPLRGMKAFAATVASRRSRRGDHPLRERLVNRDRLLQLRLARRIAERFSPDIAALVAWQLLLEEPSQKTSAKDPARVVKGIRREVLLASLRRDPLNHESLQSVVDDAGMMGFDGEAKLGAIERATAEPGVPVSLLTWLGTAAHGLEYKKAALNAWRKARDAPGDSQELLTLVPLFDALDEGEDSRLCIARVLELKTFIPTPALRARFELSDPSLSWERGSYTAALEALKDVQMDPAEEDGAWRTRSVAHILSVTGREALDIARMRMWLENERGRVMDTADARGATDVDAAIGELADGGAEPRSSAPADRDKAPRDIEAALRKLDPGVSEPLWPQEREKTETASKLAPWPPPIVLAIDAGLVPALGTDSRIEDMIDRDLPAMRDRVLAATGVLLPSVQVTDRGLDSGQYVVEAHGRVVARGVVNAAGESAQLVPTEEGKSGPAEHWDLPRVLIDRLETALRDGIRLFIGWDEVNGFIQETVESAPTLARELGGHLRDDRFRMKLIAVLRLLADEQVPISEIAVILKTVAGTEGSDSLGAAEVVRKKLSSSLPGNTRRYMLTLDHEYESTLRALSPDLETGSVDAPTEPLAEFLASIAAGLGEFPVADTVLVVEMAEMRPHLRRFLAPRFPALAVLAADELIDLSPSPDRVIEAPQAQPSSSPAQANP